MMSGDMDWIPSAPPNRLLSDHIAEQLREAIVAGQFEAGQRIVEREIAEAMQTSRGPVRDALLLLEAEGLVVRSVHRGTFVARLTTKDAEEIWTLRQAIESVVVEYALKRASPQDWEELDNLVEEMAAKIKAGYSLSDATELDLDFHRTLCRISGHKRALAAWEALSAQTRILLVGHRKRNPRDFPDRAVSWHRRLVDALRDGDLDRSQDELAKHLATTVEGLITSSGEDRA
jgi:DNA-binding GntR family transcriptional regulator